MWICRKCQAHVGDDFEFCWRCGTSVEGEEDPDFVTADEALPITEPTDFLRLDPGKQLSDAELPNPPLDLVACFQSDWLPEAKRLMEELTRIGVPSRLEQTGWLAKGNVGFPCQVMIRSADLAKAASIIKEFKVRQRARRD